MWGLEKEDKEAKGPYGSGGSTDPYFRGRVQHDRGFVGKPVQFARVSHSVSDIHGYWSIHT